MKKITFSCIFLVIILSLTLQGCAISQKAKPRVTEIKIGESVPTVLKSKNYGLEYTIGQPFVGTISNTSNAAKISPSRETND